MPRTQEAPALLATTLATLIATIPAQAWAQDAPAQQMQRVEITGSSIKRIDAETALPVQVITREQIQKSGATNVEQLLQTISSVSSSGGLTAASASGATTGGISAVSLHGLTSIRTLVLLNGRRIAPYGIGFTGDSVSVDVNSIPLAAIERVEVLKDGASAVYGSDAIAGVINFILRQEFKGLELTADYGDTTHGGAKFKKAAGTFGFGNLSTDRFNVMMTASYQKEAALFGRDRADFAGRAYDVTNTNDTTSGNTFPGNIVPADGSGGTLNPSAPDCPGPYSFNDPLFPPTRCRYDPSLQVTLLPASERTSVFASGKFAITPDIHAFAEASYNKNKIRTVIQPVPISDQFNIPLQNTLCSQAPYNNTVANACVSTFLLTPSSPYYPTAFATTNYGGTPDLLVRYRSALTGNRDITDVSEAPRAVVGVKGLAMGWDFDVAGLWSQSKVKEQVSDGFPLLTQLMPLLNSGLVNPFGPSDPGVEAQVRATNFTGEAYSIKSSMTSLAGKASREIMQLSAGPLGVAFGGEMRKEKFDFSASAALQAGDVSGYGGNFLPTSHSRDVGAVFGEANIPIVKNLEANVAVRYDHYEGVGSSTTPKASLRWQPIPQLLLRTSYGKGFRAPSLQDLFLPQQTSVTTPGLSDPDRCPVTNNGNDCQTQFNVQLGGEANLKPEKSKNFTLGAVLEPVNNVSIGIDYFQVRLDNTIVNGVNPAIILGDTTQYANLITRAPQTPADIAAGIPGSITAINQININLGTTKVSGLDFDVKWRIPTADMGRFTVSGTATYFIKFDTSKPDGSFTGNVDRINPATGGVIPRFKSYLAVDWANGPWGVTVAQNYQKHYTDLADTFSQPEPADFHYRTVRSYTTYDLQGSYEASKSWRVTLGARNVFNSDPPYTNAGGQTSFQSGYDPQYADPRGRFMYARVTYTMN
ncbi:MAG: TonB-dependent receptor [Burkholderiales bacterium]|nr:TonB-dependent receptor [Burkholderiales bacterium]